MKVNEQDVHAALNKLHQKDTTKALIPIARSADGSVAYQAVVNDRGNLSSAARVEFPDGRKNSTSQS
jgi:hypothetical protein